jgi:phage gpG-like protein
MSKIEGLREYTNKLDNISKAYDKLPTEVAAIAVRFTKDRFRSQDWYDNSREAWPARKRQRGSKKRSQTLLVDTGRLKRSIRKISADSKQVVIGTDVPYAQIHNDGGKIAKSVTVKSHSRRRRSRGGSTTVKSHTRRMNLTIPKRQFIGDSNRLEMELFLHIDSKLQTALTQKS